MIDLEEDEAVGILTCKGSFGGIWARREKDVLPVADLLRDIMAKVTSQENVDYNEGYWIWKFSKDYKMLVGKKLVDKDD